MNRQSPGSAGYFWRVGAILVAIVLYASAFGQTDSDETITTVGPVSGAQTMWSIANENRPDTRASIPQFMLAFVERNPNAFIAGNVNLLREGAVLEVPSVDEALAISSGEAQRRLDEQMEWFAELSREERVALRERAETDPPSVIEEPEPVVEPEEIAPEPDPVLETEEDIAEPEAVPEPEPVPVEPERAPEPVDVVPEPVPETDVAIVDDVPEPDPIIDPVEDPAPTEPAQEVLPEAPDRTPDPMFEPDPEPQPARAGEAPDELPTSPVADPDTPAPTDTAPPIAPGPGPEPGWMDRVSWWMWAGLVLVLLLGLLLILRAIDRRRDVAVIDSELSDSTAVQAEEESPWAEFEDAVVASEPDVEERTAVLEGPHPAERIDEEPVEEREDIQPPDQDPRKVGELDDLDMAATDSAEPETELPESRPQDAEFDWHEGEEDGHDLSEFSLRPGNDQEASDRPAVHEPAGHEQDGLDETDEPDDPEEDREFDLTNFDFDDTVVGGQDEDRTVRREDEPVEDKVDDSVPARPGASLDDLDEVMSRDLRSSGLLDGDGDEKLTEIAPPPEDEEDSAAPQRPERSEQAATDQPVLSDQEAEVMIDLARLTAEGGDRQYARDLLAEVMRDGSDAMAEQARQLQASLR